MDSNKIMNMRKCISFLLLVKLFLFASGGCSSAEDLAVTQVFVPKASGLHAEIRFDNSLENIENAILKVIPLGVTAKRADKLFLEHMPRSRRDKHKLENIPKKLKEKPYICFRLLDSTSFRYLGRGWIEALFYFKDEKLWRVYVGIGSIST